MKRILFLFLVSFFLSCSFAGDVTVPGNTTRGSNNINCYGQSCPYLYEGCCDPQITSSTCCILAPGEGRCCRGVSSCLPISFHCCEDGNGACDEGTTCCGNYCCKSGEYCSNYVCVSDPWTSDSYSTDVPAGLAAGMIAVILLSVFIPLIFICICVGMIIYCVCRNQSRPPPPYVPLATPNHQPTQVFPQHAPQNVYIPQQSYPPQQPYPPQQSYPPQSQQQMYPQQSFPPQQVYPPPPPTQQVFSSPSQQNPYPPPQQPQTSYPQSSSYSQEVYAPQ